MGGAAGGACRSWAGRHSCAPRLSGESKSRRPASADPEARPCGGRCESPGGCRPTAGDSAAGRCVCALASSRILDLVLAEEVEAAGGNRSLDATQRVVRHQAQALRPGKHRRQHRQRQTDTGGSMRAAEGIAQPSDLLGRDVIGATTAEQRQRAAQVPARVSPIAVEILIAGGCIRRESARQAPRRWGRCLGSSMPARPRATRASISTRNRRASSLLGW